MRRRHEQALVIQTDLTRCQEPPLRTVTAITVRCTQYLHLLVFGVDLLFEELPVDAVLLAQDLPHRVDVDTAASLLLVLLRQRRHLLPGVVQLRLVCVRGERSIADTAAPW